MCHVFINSYKEKNVLKQKLIQLGQKNKYIFIATPFFTFNSVLQNYIKNKNKIRLVIRLCTATSYSALEKIIDNSNFEINYFISDTFHSKIYRF